jgi:hypothetical protein
MTKLASGRAFVRKISHEKLPPNENIKLKSNEFQVDCDSNLLLCGYCDKTAQ